MRTTRDRLSGFIARHPGMVCLLLIVALYGAAFLFSAGAEVLKEDTASQYVIVGPFVTTATGYTVSTALTIGQGDVWLSKNGAAPATKNESSNATHATLGYYRIPLDATDTNTAGNLEVMVYEPGYLRCKKTCLVLPTTSYNAFVSNTGGGLRADVRAIQGTAPSTSSAGVLNVTLANAAHGGATATLRLGAAGATPAFYATNSSGDAVRFEVTGGNAHGFHVVGFGTGHGMYGEGGLTGDGIRGTGGFTSGDGIRGFAPALGDGIHGQGTGATYAGIYGEGFTGAVDIRGDITGSVSGSVASVAGNVGGNVAGSVNSLTTWDKTGYALSTAGVNAVRDSILADSTPFNGASIAAILTDTGTTLEGHLTDIKGTGFAKNTHSLPQCLTATGFSTHSAADTATALKASTGWTAGGTASYGDIVKRLHSWAWCKFTLTGTTLKYYDDDAATLLGTFTATGTGRTPQ